MKQDQRIYLLDVDDTLLDTQNLKREIQRKFLGLTHKKAALKIFWGEYKNTISRYKFLDIKKFSESMSKKLNLGKPKLVYDILTGLTFKRFLFPTALETISLLKKNGKVIILSLGDPVFQRVKIRKSGIEKAAGIKNVYVVQNKIKALRNILRTNKNKHGKQIIFIDDKSDLLKKAFKLSNNIITVRIHSDKNKPKGAINPNYITFSFKSIEKAQYLLENVVSRLNTNLVIVRGISAENIKKLVYFTQNDKNIKRYTQDTKRFGTARKFCSWYRKGKIVYTLIDRSSGLCGIIWFSREKYKSYNFTFAIRMYGKTRGKGYARAFIKKVFEDAANKIDYKMWLSVDPKNVIAIKLYKKFGFKLVAQKNKNIIMTFS